MCFYNFTCQFISTNLCRLVCGSVTFKNAYIILLLFISSMSSFKPPSPEPTTFKSLLWPSYPNKALQINNNFDIKYFVSSI